MDKLTKQLTCLLRFICPSLYSVMISENHEKKTIKAIISFFSGFGLGQLYYMLFLKEIPLLCYFFIGLVISIILGFSCVVSIQMRCISCLLLPMYFGKAGRGVLKAIVLTYVVAGPITNLGLNAQEVVRVFACTTQLSYNLSKHQYALTYKPLNKAIFNFSIEINEMKDTIRSIYRLISPIVYEIEGTADLNMMKFENYFTDVLLDIYHEEENSSLSNKEIDQYEELYTKKMHTRCENQLSHAVTMCFELFSSVYEECSGSLPPYADVICLSLMLPHICDVKRLIRSNICDFTKQIDAGFGKNYSYLKMAKLDFISDLETIRLQHKVHLPRKSVDVQDAKETGDRVVNAFEEKFILMNLVIVVVDIFIALLFLRIPIASANYHDLYLTSIDFDNVYITDYFKRIDNNRRKKNKFALLPLKKMERSRYIDVYSAVYIPSERSKLLTQILKVMLEVVTATTFVMLDRLFYEALDVVKRYALETPTPQGTQDIEIQIDGKGALSSMLRKIVKEFSFSESNKMVSNEACIPRPRAMPIIYYFKIYGGYLWILILLYINPYTSRLRSYFYPEREKRRILHLYNDILKKRTRMQKTLRRKAIQSVRAHYLSGENLLSIRMKYPKLLGWLNKIPMARMKCLICEETEPRLVERHQQSQNIQAWHSCIKTRCPFVYCNECWHEVGAQCLACDPALTELSDVESLSDDNPPRY